MATIDQYVVIDKSLLENRIAAIDRYLSTPEKFSIAQLDIWENEKFGLQQIIEQSKPLKPIAEDIFNAGKIRAFPTSDKNLKPDFEDYLTNLTI